MPDVPPPSFASFGEMLKYLRRRARLTQRELAIAAGYSESQISRLEQNQRLMDPATLLAVFAPALGIADQPSIVERLLALAQAARTPAIGVAEVALPSEDAAQALYANMKDNTLTANGPSPVQSPQPPAKAERKSAARPTPFVGRARELAALTAALDDARAGHGQLRFVTGGAGQGKSMLVQEFIRQAQVADRDLLAVTGHCNAYTGVGDPYLPFREALALLAGEVEIQSAGGWTSVENAHRLSAALPISLPALVERAPDLIGPFVAAQSLPARAAGFAPPHSPWVKQLTRLCARGPSAPLEEQSIFSQYTALLKAIVARKPLLLILEDLHWVDLPSSGLLFHLSQRVRNSRILIVGTYRPDEVAQRRGDTPHPLAAMVGEFKRQHGAIQIDLDSLALMEGRQFVEAYVDAQPNRLDATFRKALFQHTGGNALFTVELLNAMQVRGDLRQDDRGRWVASSQMDWHTLPAKVEGVIETQLARLDDSSQAILRVACVQGEHFSAEIIAQILNLDYRTLIQQLSQELGRRHRLVSSQELNWLGQTHLSHYRFRHYLFQRYLYQNLDETERAYLHEAVGNALEALYGDQAAQIAVQLAHHFRQAGKLAKAVDALLLAGQQARQIAAYQEAVVHLTEGLALLERLPASPAHDRQETKYLLAIGIAMSSAGDFDANAMERYLLRARALCQELGDTAHMWPALYLLAEVQFLRGEYYQMRDYGEELLRVSREQRDLEPSLMAYLSLGTSLQQLGNFTNSAMYLEQMLARYDPTQHHDLVFQYVTVDVRVLAFLHLAMNRWLLGYPDQARRYSEAASQVATETAHPHVQVMALFMNTWLHEVRREVQETSRKVAEVIRLATEYQFIFVLSHARIYEGWALIEQNQAELGLARLQQGIAELHGYSQTKNQGYFATLQARGYAALGQSQAGLVVIDAALAGVEQNGEHWYDAELRRHKGELLRMQGAPVSIVQGYYKEAIAIARRQRAKMWELRATVSLCRLWQAQGQSAAAHTRLAEIYDWFTEGFDTPDLLEAEALLAELASP